MSAGIGGVLFYIQVRSLTIAAGENAQIMLHVERKGHTREIRRMVVGAAAQIRLLEVEQEWC